MVWQGMAIYQSNRIHHLNIWFFPDFLFGCGQYPAYDEFLERVKPEVEQAVTRLRHHASLVIFAGNNEGPSGN